MSEESQRGGFDEFALSLSQYSIEINTLEHWSKSLATSESIADFFEKKQCWPAKFVIFTTIV